MQDIHYIITYNMSCQAPVILYVGQGNNRRTRAGGWRVGWQRRWQENATTMDGGGGALYHIMVAIILYVLYGVSLSISSLDG